MKGQDPVTATAPVPFPRRTDAELVLEVLRRSKGHWVPNLYLLTGVMVHSRVADLRRKGYQIEHKCFGKRDHRYRLLSEPDKETA